MRKLDVTRLPAAYRYMTELDPSGWAWEFLRRNPDYRADAAKLTVQPEAARPPDGSGRDWGLQSPGEPGPPRR
jgi:transcriptional regulator